MPNYLKRPYNTGSKSDVVRKKFCEFQRLFLKYLLKFYVTLFVNKDPKTKVNLNRKEFADFDRNRNTVDCAIKLFTVVI